MELIRKYYQLTKPGIIKGNLLTFTGAFLFASNTSINILNLVLSAIGTILIIASACVINNVIDAKIDSKMARTKKRALVTGEVRKSSAVIYGVILGLSGFLVLSVYINQITALLGLFAFFMYVVVYGFVKRKSSYGTHVGTIPGAIPPVAGYTSVTAQLDMTAFLLFLALVTWQMAHFYAIAIFRVKEYKAAGIPVLPLTKGVISTKRQIVIYIVLYVLSVFALGSLRVDMFFTIAASLSGLYWLQQTVTKMNSPVQTWAKSVFGHSLLVLLIFSIALAISPWIP